MDVPLRQPAWRRYFRFWRADIARDVDDELRSPEVLRRALALAGAASPSDRSRRGC